jgi:ferredoxin
LTPLSFDTIYSPFFTFCDGIYAYIRLRYPFSFFSEEVVSMAYVITEECTACGLCAEECPVEAISEGDIYVIDPDLCTECGVCADTCPVGAIEGPEEE